MGCLRRQLGLLGLLGVACVVAAQASAAPAPTLFRLTIVGTAHQEWSVTSAPVDTDGCRRTVTSEGTRTATFRTGTAVIVRVVAGRVLPVDVLTIETGAQGVSEASIGKYIGDRVFIGYRQRFLSAQKENTVEGRIEYEISRSVAAEATIGDLNKDFSVLYTKDF